MIIRNLVYLIILQSMRCLLLVGPHMVLPQEGVQATGGNLCTVGPRGDPEEGEDKETIEGKEMKNGVGDRREGRKEGHDCVHIHLHVCVMHFYFLQKWKWFPSLSCYT